MIIKHAILSTDLGRLEASKQAILEILDKRGEVDWDNKDDRCASSYLYDIHKKFSKAGDYKPFENPRRSVNYSFDSQPYIASLTNINVTDVLLNLSKFLNNYWK